MFARRIRSGGGACLVRRRSNRVALWDVKHEGNVYRVVYDKYRKNVVTVLFCKRVRPEAVGGQPKVSGPGAAAGKQAFVPFRPLQEKLGSTP
jgi:hypothetical protein